MSAAGQRAADIFSANRANSRISLAVKSEAGITRRARVFEDGPLRVRFPGGPAPDAEVVMVNTAGGIVGGDRLAIDINVGNGAALTVTAAAAEKVYRTLGPAAKTAIRLDVASGASLAWMPQETILFDRAKLARSIEVDLAGDARLLLAEAVVFGRTGMGEAVTSGALRDRWRIRRSGRLLYAETVRLDGAIAEQLAKPAMAAGGAAVATVLVAPADEAMVEAVRACRQDCAGEVGASAWNGIALVRLCASDGARLRHDLARLLTTLRAKPLPRVWSC